MDAPRLVASDLDGTLLRPDGSVSDRTRAVLGALSAAGTPFVMVTGRPLRWIPPVLEQTGVHAEVVCNNGALVHDPRTGEVVAEWPLPSDVLTLATTRLRAAVRGVAFAAEHRHRLVHEEQYPVRWTVAGQQVEVVTPDGLVAEPALKLLVRQVSGDADTLLDACTRALDGIATPTHSGGLGLVEISAAGVDKARGLAWVAQRHGVGAADVLAFGDMPNDVAMLRWAGRSVAVGEAHPDARAAADDRAAASDEDGVAAYLERYVTPAAPGR